MTRAMQLALAPVVRPLRYRQLLFDIFDKFGMNKRPSILNYHGEIFGHYNLLRIHHIGDLVYIVSSDI